VHLTLGAVTVRIHADALPELAAVLDEAVREISIHQLIAAHQTRTRTVMS
jgi:hypothetical protein